MRISRYCKLWMLFLPFMLSACTNQTLIQRIDALDQQVKILEQKIDALSAHVQSNCKSQQEIPIPCRSRSEIQAQLQQLIAQREKLLLEYTPQHPTIVDLDRQIGILEQQLEMLDMKQNEIPVQ